MGDERPGPRGRLAGPVEPGRDEERLPDELDRLIGPTPTSRLMDRPVLFSAVVTLSLGLLGSVGWLRGRYGPQPVPSGLVGFLYGVAVGLVVTLAYLAFRRWRFRQGVVFRLAIAAAVVLVTIAFVAR